MITPLESESFNDEAKRILIVDDNLEIHEDFKRILNPGRENDEFDTEDAAFFGTEVTLDTHLNFKLDFATQGQEALKKVQQAIDDDNRFAVVFMDVRMPPGWDGIETTKRIWDIDPDLQVVICTAYSDYSWDKMVATLGHSDKLLILRKPFDIIEAEQAAHTFSKKWALMQESRRQSLFLEQTTDLSPSMIFWVSSDGSITYVNQSVCKILGRSQQEFSSRKISETIPDWGGDNWQEIWDQSLRETCITQERELLTATNEPIAAELIITGLDFRNSKLLCISAQDIRQRLKTLDELAHARDAALEAVRMKSQFLATMSHEIRTPMNGVVGMAELLAHTRLNESQREYVEIINHSGIALLSIINDILDSAKIESGKLQFQRINFNLKEVIRGSIQTVNHKAVNSQVDLMENLSPDLPEILNGDPGRLRQALVNLLANGVKFTHKGSIRLSASLGSEHEDYYVIHFSIKDTGIGMDPVYLESIFQPFTQADTTDTRKYGGTGLGLTITNQIIQAMGGKIDVTSELEKGSEFTFSIKLNKPSAEAEPLASQPQNPEPQPKQSTRPTSSISSTNKLKILIAEDNPVNQKVTTLQLKQLGQTADIVENGADAVEAVKNNDYDMVLMDCQMPVMDGFEATRQIRKIQSKPIRIIAVTANAMKEDRDRCLDAGMDDYLSKPLTSDDLARVLNINTAQDTPGPFPTEPQVVQAPPAQAPNPVDEQRFMETTANDPDLRREIINEYLLQAEEILTLMESNIFSGDYSEVKKQAHKLAGSSATCGMDSIVPTLRTLEHLNTSDHNQLIKLHQEAAKQLLIIRAYLTEHYS